MSLPLGDQQSRNPFPVEPTGFLIGSLIACCLYGVHLSQIYRFLNQYSDPLKTRLFVFWIWTLSTSQIIIIVSSCWKYFVDGISEPSIWGEFWWPLSVQDGLVPLMAFTAQLYFGKRVWKLFGRPRWMAYVGLGAAFVTLCFGFALAITARIWAADPYVSSFDFSHRKIGVPSQAMAMTWLGLSAILDGLLTGLLLAKFFQAKRTMAIKDVAWRLVALTMETVLLTHLVGAIMFVIFVASPSETRTKSNIFWILLEMITELYALSVLFTINSRDTERFELEDSTGISLPELGQTVLDRRVEGYRGTMRNIETQLRSPTLPISPYISSPLDQGELGESKEGFFGNMGDAKSIVHV